MSLNIVSALPVRQCERSRAKLYPAQIMKDVDMSYHLVTFNGSFMHENVFRRAGSPEVDAAWESIGVNCEHTQLALAEHTNSGLHPERQPHGST